MTTPTTVITALSDPAVVCETITALFTLCYMGRLAIFKPQQPNVVNRLAFINKVNSRGPNSTASIRERLCSFFDVGNLISIPKRSLRHQQQQARIDYAAHLVRCKYF